MFVDASTIIAILTRESDADDLANALDGARSPITFTPEPGHNSASCVAKD